ncbi:MAG: hypothetical protein EPO08_01265 [Rhodospirillaceae bacterium]|nr:MAG: hypothetical protein EPO08_01265 [Rhodospirillaceae bacterium]
MKYAKTGAALTGILATFLVAILNPAFAEADQILTFTGLGPVRIGMTVAQAEAALGTTLSSIYPDMPKTCWSGRRVDGIDGAISYLIEDGKIVRIDINDSAWPKPERVVPSVSTEQGIRIDSFTDDVKKAYGSRLIIKFHPQGDEGDENYLFMKVFSDDKKRGLLFEIWEGKIKSFHVGTTETFDAEEPCD